MTPDLYYKLYLALERFHLKFTENNLTSVWVVERDGSEYTITLSSLEYWRDKANVRSTDLMWDDIMHICNELDRKLS